MTIPLDVTVVSVLVIAMVATLVLRQFLPKTPTWLLPYVSVALAIGAEYVVTVLDSRSFTWDSLWLGSVAGLTAAGVWGGGPKQFFRALGFVPAKPNEKNGLTGNPP